MCLCYQSRAEIRTCVLLRHLASVCSVHYTYETGHPMHHTKPDVHSTIRNRTSTTPYETGRPLHLRNWTSKTPYETGRPIHHKKPDVHYTLRNRTSTTPYETWRPIHLRKRTSTTPSKPDVHRLALARSTAPYDIICCLYITNWYFLMH